MEPEPVGERTLWVRRNEGQYVMACAHDQSGTFLWVYVPDIARLPQDTQARAALMQWLLLQNGRHFVGTFSIKEDGRIYYEWAGPVPGQPQAGLVGQAASLSHRLTGQLFKTVWQLIDAEAATLQSQIAAVVADAHTSESATP